MEIQIDFPTVHGVIAAEQQSSSAELSALGPLHALTHSQLRHDQRLAAALDAGSLACKAGCFWCCYFSVDVRPIEVFRILHVMTHEFDGTERTRIERQIASNVQLLGNADGDARLRLNIRCPFLNQGRCIIYTARPQTCRNYHATNVAGCQRCYEHPEDLDIDPEFAPLTYQIGIAHVDGFSKAMAAQGYDHRAYEMNAALAHALAAPQASWQQFMAKQAAFGDLDGEPVPLEFDAD